MYTRETMNTVPALHIEGVKKVYEGKVEALKGVTLTIPEGQFFGLLGPNGAGKTTLISIISGLALKTEGTVEVSGASLDGASDLARSYVGLVPQEFNCNWFEKVEDIVVNQAGYYGIPEAVARPRAEVLLKDLGLWDKRDTQAMKLSGGMKRRLMIARALIHEPKILLLDEPTAGVDVELRREMWDFLRKLSAGGTTIILTTHYLEEAELLCERIAIINKGAIVEEGSVKELLTKLNFVTLRLDTVEPVYDATMQLLRGYPITKVDEHTLELTLSPGETVNDAFRKLTAIGVQIANIRNTGSRLEELFVRLITTEKEKTV